MKVLWFLLVVFCCVSVNAQRKLSQEGKIFQNLKGGVFTVYGYEGHGSGFLVDERGLVLTNEHVIARSRQIGVQLDDTTKVEARLLASNKSSDIAVLLIHPRVAHGRPVLRLAPSRAEIAIEGERVLAIGSPLNQMRMLTSGIISKVGDYVIVSDLNINPGNSGGPLLNSDSEVIGINTFVQQGEYGPGLAGSIVIWKASELLEAARNELAKVRPPSDKLLPVMPKSVFPLASLIAAAKRSLPADPYDISALINTGNFKVRVSTPVSQYRQRKVRELELAEKRMEREWEAGLTDVDNYDAFRDLKEWAAAVGRYSPTVLIQIMPDVGQTGASVAGNIFLGLFEGALQHFSGLTVSPFGFYSYEFKADLQDAQLLVDGKVQPEIDHEVQFLPADFWARDYWGVYSAKDIARAGVLVFPHYVFLPSTNRWPVITLQLVSLTDLKDTIRFQIPKETCSQIFMDFEPYVEQLEADSAAVKITKHDADSGDSIFPRIGMTVEELVRSKGREPDTSYAMEFGKALGSRWKGRVYKYILEEADPRMTPPVISHDPLIRKKLIPRLTEKYFFFNDGGILRLNHWDANQYSDFHNN